MTAKIAEAQGSRPRRRFGRSTLAVAGVSVLGASVAANGAVLVGSAGASTKAHFTGAPITIASEAPINSPLASFPQIFSSERAALRAINASGGINGHRVDLMTCNGQGNPNAEVACATSAVKAGAVAMVGNLAILNPSGAEDALQAGNTADVGAIAISPAQYSSPVSFPLAFFNGSFTACTTQALAKIVGKKVFALETPLPANQAAFQAATASAKNQRADLVGTAQAGTSTTDFSPLVQQVAGANPDEVISVLLPTQDGSFVTASKSAGHDWSYCTADGNIFSSQLIQLGSAVNKWYEGSPLPAITATSTYPVLKTFIAQMKAEQKSGDAGASLSAENYNLEMLNAWLGVRTFAQVARSIKGPIDNSTFLAAMGTAKVNTGVVPPIDFAHPVGSAPFQRVFNGRIFLQQWIPSKKAFKLIPSGTVQNAVKAIGF